MNVKSNQFAREYGLIASLNHMAANELEEVDKLYMRDMM